MRLLPSSLKTLILCLIGKKAPTSLTAVGAGFLVTFQSLGDFRESSSALGTVAGGLTMDKTSGSQSRRRWTDRCYTAIRVRCSWPEVLQATSREKSRATWFHDYYELNFNLKLEWSRIHKFDLNYLKKIKQGDSRSSHQFCWLNILPSYLLHPKGYRFLSMVP